MDGQHEMSVHVYPNPTTGHYSIDMTNCECADVTIFNALGEVVLSKHTDSKQSHMVEGYLPVGGEYYVTIKTSASTQTFKLIVKR